MIGEKSDYSTIIEETSIDTTTETGLIPAATVNLSEESKVILEQILAETDSQKAQDLTHLFNANQNKKTMVRVNKLSDLLDTITDQALARFTARPDEISNKELLDSLKVVQDLIERGQKQVSGVGETPLIQVNQQNNEVNFGGTTKSLSRDSRERVKSAVLGLLDSITAAPIINSSEELIEDPPVTVEDITEIIIEDGENG